MLNDIIDPTMYHIYLAILAVVDNISNLLFLKSINLNDTSDCYQFNKTLRTNYD